MQFICNDLRKFETAKGLNKCQSTIGKEIKNKRKKVKKQGKIFALFFICTILLITNLLHFYELYQFVKNQIYPLLKHI